MTRDELEALLGPPLSPVQLRLEEDIARINDAEALAARARAARERAATRLTASTRAVRRALDDADDEYRGGAG